MPVGRLPAFGGDVTSTNGIATLTLNNTGVAANSYGLATHVPQFSVDSKGRLLLAANVLITPAFSSITGKPTTLAGYGITDAVASGGAIGAANLVSNETPSGAINDVNVTFTLAFTPIGLFQLFSNGVLLEPAGGDYTRSGTTITMNVAPISSPAAKLRAYYIK